MYNIDKMELRSINPLYSLFTAQSWIGSVKGFLMEEIWKPVVGYEQLYEVSTLGNMRRANGRILNPVTTTKGYKRIGLNKNRKASYFSVHSLVMRVFIGERPSGAIIRHINGKPSDNRLTNLAYGTHKENADDKKLHGTVPTGEKHHNTTLTREDVDNIKKLYVFGDANLGSRGLGKMFGVNQMTILRIVKQTTWNYEATK